MTEKYDDLIWQATREKGTPVYEMLRQTAQRAFIGYLEVLTRRNPDNRLLLDEQLVSLLREVFIKGYIHAILDQNPEIDNQL